MDKIKKNLQLSAVFTIILSIIFLLMIISSIFIGIFYKDLISVINDNIPEYTKEIISNMGKAGLVLIYILVGLLTLPFLIESITNYFNTNKIVRENDKPSKSFFISLFKNAAIFTVFGFAFIVGIFIAYFTLLKGNIWFLLIPILTTLPFYILGSIFKFSALKDLEKML